MAKNLLGIPFLNRASNCLKIICWLHKPGVIHSIPSGYPPFHFLFFLPQNIIKPSLFQRETRVLSIQTLSMDSLLMKRIFWSSPNGVLTACTEWLRHFNPTCAVHKDCGGWGLSSRHSLDAEHQLHQPCSQAPVQGRPHTRAWEQGYSCTSQMYWVQFMAAGLFHFPLFSPSTIGVQDILLIRILTFLSFHLKFSLFQREARVLSTICRCFESYDDFYTKGINFPVRFQWQYDPRKNQLETISEHLIFKKWLGGHTL